MDYEMDATRQAIDVLDTNENNSYVNLRELTQSFVKARINNSNSAESIKAKALEKLAKKLDTMGDDEVRIAPMLEIIETLGSQSKTDLEVLMKASEAGSPNNKGSGSNIFVFSGENSDSESRLDPKLSTKQFALLEQLFIAAETIVKEKI